LFKFNDRGERTKNFYEINRQQIDLGERTKNLDATWQHHQKNLVDRYRQLFGHILDAQPSL
jgi:hypothetical protein